IGTTRRFVGETDVTYHPIGVYTIRPRQHGDTKIRHRCIAVCVWNFGGAIKGQDIQSRVKMRDGAARFQGNATMAANRKVECDSSMRHRNAASTSPYSLRTLAIAVVWLTSKACASASASTSTGNSSTLSATNSAASLAK